MHMEYALAEDSAKCGGGELKSASRQAVKNQLQLTGFLIIAYSLGICRTGSLRRLSTVVLRASVLYIPYYVLIIPR
jgi:hypothetical protein